MGGYGAVMGAWSEGLLSRGGRWCGYFGKTGQQGCAHPRAGEVAAPPCGLVYYSRSPESRALHRHPTPYTLPPAPPPTSPPQMLSLSLEAEGAAVKHQKHVVEQECQRRMEMCRKTVQRKRALLVAKEPCS